MTEPHPTDRGNPETDRVGSTDTNGTEAAKPRPAWIKWLIRLAALVIVVLVGKYIIGSVDWKQVGESLKGIAAWQFAILVLLIVVRQFLNAAPLAFFVPGLGFGRAALSDLGAATVATVAPPPADLVVRFSMFRAWNIGAARGAAGLTLNMVLFYIVRFAAPIFGIVVLMAINRFDDRLGLVALLSGLAGVLMVAAILLIVRSDRGAAWVGSTTARMVRKIKPDKADPQDWAERMKKFRAQVAEDLKSHWKIASASLILMLTSESILFLLCVRFVGVPQSSAGALAVVGAFFITYPLTALPANGLGVLDAALFGLLILETGKTFESQLVAAIVIWRLATMILPLIAGGLTLLLFKRSHPEAVELADELEAKSSGLDEPG